MPIATPWFRLGAGRPSSADRPVVKWRGSRPISGEPLRVAGQSSIHFRNSASSGGVRPSDRAYSVAIHPMIVSSSANSGMSSSSRASTTRSESSPSRMARVNVSIQNASMYPPCRRGPPRRPGRPARGRHQPAPERGALAEAQLPRQPVEPASQAAHGLSSRRAMESSDGPPWGGSPDAPLERRRGCLPLGCGEAEPSAPHK